MEVEKFETRRIEKSDWLESDLTFQIWKRKLPQSSLPVSPVSQFPLTPLTKKGTGSRRVCGCAGVQVWVWVCILKDPTARLHIPLYYIELSLLLIIVALTVRMTSTYLD